MRSRCSCWHAWPRPASRVSIARTSDARWSHASTSAASVRSLRGHVEEVHLSGQSTFAHISATGFNGSGTLQAELLFKYMPAARARTHRVCCLGPLRWCPGLEGSRDVFLFLKSNGTEPYMYCCGSEDVSTHLNFFAVTGSPLLWKEYSALQKLMNLKP